MKLKMINWLNLREKDQIELFNKIGSQTGLQPFAIEKDAWVTLVIRMLFRSEISSNIVFKGGTSLSKSYNLIERFSEDVDFTICREYLGFKGYLTKGKIRKLRRASQQFVSKILPLLLHKQLTEYGIEDGLFKIEVPNTKISDQDPEIVLVNYKSVFEEGDYVQSRVLIEIGARSLMKPFENKNIQSIIDVHYPDSNFTEKGFFAQTAIPDKTFLEKLILLHEEFQKETKKIRYHRKSRHLYDILKIMKSEYGEKALMDHELFEYICAHREKFTPVKNINYHNLRIKNLNLFPPGDFIDLYRNDYKEMQTNMIYGDSLDFDELIEQLKFLIS